MTRAGSQIGLNGTRLVRFLSDLAVSDVALSHTKFAERLGRWIDFGDSLRLSQVHAELRKLPYEPNPTSFEDLKTEIVQARISLAQGVVASFVPDAGAARFKLPTNQAGIPLAELVTFEPYHRFYAAHQREFEFRIQTLQLKVRDGVSGVSPGLAQLAALDEAVRDILAIHIGKCLALIPQLLGRRFHLLLEEHRSSQAEPGEEADDGRPREEVLATWTRPNGWLNRFFNEMQGLLLAELELRLLPVLGLVEAADEEVNRR